MSSLYTQLTSSHLISCTPPHHQFIPSPPSLSLDLILLALFFVALYIINCIIYIYKNNQFPVLHSTKKGLAILADPYQIRYAAPPPTGGRRKAQRFGKGLKRDTIKIKTSQVNQDIYIGRQCFTSNHAFSFLKYNTYIEEISGSTRLKLA